jgi:hypothetical protein
MRSSISLYQEAVEARHRAAHSLLAGTRRRWQRIADDLQEAGKVAEHVERLQRAAEWDAEQAQRRQREAGRSH